MPRLRNCFYPSIVVVIFFFGGVKRVKGLNKSFAPIVLTSNVDLQNHVNLIVKFYRYIQQLVLIYRQQNGYDEHYVFILRNIIDVLRNKMSPVIFLGGHFIF